ncbi:hypothetical protein K7X08_019614 [Anisodus acutangulus]|uniref:Uncharacterized protein n=1 Tax=Anisodus acutangulus TaxID=402998 RepID=A0A9Q1RQS5_9SOLA|nr:hypothetical protein K7X08_019614 [Anisodus acutangulus]
MIGGSEKENSKYKKIRNKDLSLVWFWYDALFTDIIATGESPRATTQEQLSENGLDDDEGTNYVSDNEGHQFSHHNDERSDENDDIRNIDFIRFPEPSSKKRKSRNGSGQVALAVSVELTFDKCMDSLEIIPEVLFSGVSTAAVEGEADVEVAEGYTITRFCDKMIDLFLNEKPKSKDWRKYMVFREEWRKYRDRFYSRCQTRADAEADSQMKEKMISLTRKLGKIDDEMERHKTYDSLEDRDAYARLGTRCLSAVSAYDNTLEMVGTSDTAQAKFDDILNSPSVD